MPKKARKPAVDKSEYYLRSQIRRVWNWSLGKRLALHKARHPKKKGLFLCAICGKYFKKGYVAVDHKLPAVPVEGLGKVNNHPDWNQLYERMFLGELQILCTKDHNKKSQEENKQRRKSKKDTTPKETNI